eukprot:gene10761-2848_t
MTIAISFNHHSIFLSSTSAPTCYVQQQQQHQQRSTGCSTTPPAQRHKHKCAIAHKMGVAADPNVFYENS